MTKLREGDRVRVLSLEEIIKLGGRTIIDDYSRTIIAFEWTQVIITKDMMKYLDTEQVIRDSSTNSNEKRYRLEETKFFV